METKQGQDSEVLETPFIFFFYYYFLIGKGILFLYRPKSWDAVSVWNVWGFPGMLQSAQLFSRDVPLLAEMGQDLDQHTADSGPEGDASPFCCRIPISTIRRVTPHAVPRVLWDSPWPLTDELWRISLRTLKYSQLSPPFPRLLSEISRPAETTQLLPWKIQGLKFTGTVESCGQLLQNMVQQERWRVACQLLR